MRRQRTLLYTVTLLVKVLCKIILLFPSPISFLPEPRDFSWEEWVLPHILGDGTVLAIWSAGRLWCWELRLCWCFLQLLAPGLSPTCKWRGSGARVGAGTWLFLLLHWEAPARRWRAAHLLPHRRHPSHGLSSLPAAVFRSCTDKTSSSAVLGWHLKADSLHGISLIYHCCNIKQLYLKLYSECFSAVGGISHTWYIRSPWGT